MSKYVLYQSQEWQLNEKPMYAGQPNFYRSIGLPLMGLPVIINTDKIIKATQFNLKSQCREFMKNKKLTGYKIVPLDKATALVIDYNRSKKKRKEKYLMTEEEKQVLRKFEEYKK